MNTNCIEIIGLSYLNIFHNFSIAIEKERFVTISGPNNCGKTTFLRIISNEIKTNSSVLIYNQKIEDYKVTELACLISTVIPLEVTFFQSTVEDELSFQLSTTLPKDIRQKRIKEVAKLFKLTKLFTTSVENLSDEEIIRLQLAISVINSPKIILVDDLSPYFSKKDLLELIEALKTINQDNHITIIMATNNLEAALKSDYIYIINASEIVLEGTPLEVLEKDNILNKAGLTLPFMMDLSVKLRDYDLIKNIELDMDRMVDTLWN